MVSNKKCTIGGIVKHGNGQVGFRMGFETKEQAQMYKEMMVYIVRSDGFEILGHRGYYDKKQ